MRGRFKRAGTYVYLWLIHAAEINTIKSNYPPIKNIKERKREKKSLRVLLIREAKTCNDPFLYFNIN